MLETHHCPQVQNDVSASMEKVEKLLHHKRSRTPRWGTFLVVQWLRHWASNAEGMGSILGQGTNRPYATCHDQKRGRGGGRNFAQMVASGMYTRRPSCETICLISQPGLLSHNPHSVAEDLVGQSRHRQSGKKNRVHLKKKKKKIFFV